MCGKRGSAVIPCPSPTATCERLTYEHVPIATDKVWEYIRTSLMFMRANACCLCEVDVLQLQNSGAGPETQAGVCRQSKPDQATESSLELKTCNFPTRRIFILTSTGQQRPFKAKGCSESANGPQQTDAKSTAIGNYTIFLRIGNKIYGRCD